MSAHKSVWILYAEGNSLLGIYTSERNLKKAVDLLIESRSERVLSFEKTSVNSFDGSQTWDWAYIPKKSCPYELASGGGAVPKRKYWGINLIGKTYEAIPYWNQAYKD